MALYRNSWCIFFMLLCTSVVYGEIGVDCGSGAVVGQPYTIECTNIPDTVNNGINVFLGDSDNNIIICLTSKDCVPRDGSRYSVMTPHNESLFFTILDVTTDDIDKKLYCVDDTRLDATSKPSCTLPLVQTTAVPETSTSTRITDEQTNPATTTTSMEVTEIGVNCGSGAVLGQPYTMECTNIPDTVNNGINVFLGGKVNSIITCHIKSKGCAPQDTSRYSVVTPHNESLFFTILKVTEDDNGKKLYCVDGSTLDFTPKQSCTLDCDDCSSSLSGGAIAGIVIGVLVVCGVVIIIIIVIKKSIFKKCC